MVFRKPSPIGQYSVEIIFDFVLKYLTPMKLARRYNLPCNGSQPHRVLKNMFYISRLKNPVIHMTGDAGYSILLTRRKKTVLTVHDCAFLERTSGIKRWIMLWLWLRLPVRKATCITAVSSATADEVAKHTGHDRSAIRVIPVFSPKTFPFSPRPVPSPEKKLLIVGNAPNKNVDNFIEAVKGLDYQLLIVGLLRPNQIMALKRYSIPYENVARATEEELQDYYLRADILLFASTIEGFGMPIVEAQQQGLPVITSNCSSMPEVAGEGALMVDPFSVASITEGINLLMTDTALRETLISKGLENSKRYEPGTISEKYLNLYNELLAPE
jgi:glycosyltransferase involved in cell wall biosynthesis